MLSTGLVIVVIMNSFSACTVMEGNSSVLPPKVLQKECGEDNYRHKPIQQLAAMSPSQLLDESIKEQLYHPAGSWNLSDHDDNYASLLGKYLKNSDPETIFPVLIGYLDKYAPQNSSKCDHIRISVVSGTFSDLDNNVVRLRGTPGGRDLVGAFERSVQRLKDAGFGRSSHEYNYLFNVAAHNLEMAKGTNICDEMVRATLDARHDVQMSESEYIAFSNFLTSTDPKYPTWSDVGEYGPPTLVKDSSRYFEAYRRFKEGRSPE